MVFHTHKVGLATVFCVYVLLLYADYALVYRVIEYGKNRRLEGYISKWSAPISLFLHSL